MAENSSVPGFMVGGCVVREKVPEGCGYKATASLVWLKCGDAPQVLFQRWVSDFEGFGDVWAPVPVLYQSVVTESGT